MVHEHGGKATGFIVNTKKVVSSLVGAGDVFLDIGCGPGDYLKAASGITKNLVGIDTHGPSIDKVNALGFRGIVADATRKIPLEDASVDSILLANVLHGFVENKEDKKVLSEASRILKKEGRLGIVEFRKNSLFGPPKKVRLSPIAVETLLASSGFVKIGEESVGLFNYLIIFKKK